MRTLAICLLLVTSATAQDKYIKPKAELDRLLHHFAKAELRKLQPELANLEAAIRDAAKAKRHQTKYEPGSEASGFTLPLSRTDLPKAKAKAKELATKVAELRNPRIPQIDIATDEIRCICYLVEYVADENGKRVARPVVVTVKSIFEPATVTVVSTTGKQLCIKKSTDGLKPGDKLTLDMPIIPKTRSVEEVDIELFAN